MAVCAISLLLLMLVAGVPAALALIGASLASVLLFNPDLLPALPLSIMSTATNYLLIAIPLFILAGEIAVRGRLLDPLADLTRALLAPVPGGTGAATVGTCMFFAGITGSTAAEAAAVGTFGLPVMERAGYPKAFSTALIASASTFGILIPPSLTMILFGSITQTPVAHLFLAGLVPGLVLGTAMMAMVAGIGAWRGFGQRERFDGRLLVRSFTRAAWVIGMPVVVVGGIYTGWFTPTEVAAVVVAYGLAVAAVVYRSIGWRDLVDIGRTTMRLSSMLYLILIGASLFGFVLTNEGVPQALVERVLSANVSPMEFLVLLNVVLLAMGCFFDGLSMLVISLPLVYPIATALGIDPLHLAVLMTVNIELGVLTPPVGINLFVMTGISRLRMEEVVRALWPFYLFLLAGLALITYWPPLSTWLPATLG